MNMFFFLNSCLFQAREYAEKIEKPHNLKPVMRLRDPTSGNVIIRDASHHHHRHHQRLTS